MQQSYQLLTSARSLFEGGDALTLSLPMSAVILGIKSVGYCAFDLFYAVPTNALAKQGEVERIFAVVGDQMQTLSVLLPDSYCGRRLVPVAACHHVDSGFGARTVYLVEFVPVMASDLLKDL